MLKIPKSEYEKIEKQALDELPWECCGLLGGKKEGEDILIRYTRPLKNIDGSNEHFSMDPKEQFATIKEFRERDLELIGNYHSHPETPSRMSDEDKKLAHDISSIYAIMSVADKDNPVLNFFRIDSEKEVKKLKYEILEEK